MYKDFLNSQNTWSISVNRNCYINKIEVKHLSQIYDEYIKIYTYEINNKLK